MKSLGLITILNIDAASLIKVYVSKHIRGISNDIPLRYPSEKTQQAHVLIVELAVLNRGIIYSHLYNYVD